MPSDPAPKRPSQWQQRRQSGTPDRDPESGELIATLDRTHGDRIEALRLYLDSYEGHPFLRLATWRQRDGAWKESKAVTVRMREARRVAAALSGAADRLEGTYRSMDATASQPPCDDHDPSGGTP